MRLRRLLVAAGALVVAGAAGVALWALRGSGPDGAPSPPRCDGAVIKPATDLAAELDARPPGTTFCFRAGHYDLEESLVPEDDDHFVAEDGVVLDGGDRVEFAFTGLGNDVEIRGFVIEHFSSDRQSAAIEAREGERWLVEDNEVRFNAAAGITLGDRGVARDNYVHHNGQLGIRAPSSRGALVVGNEIAFNNPDLAFNPGSDAGGTKFANTRELVVRDNYVHDNRGNGLWFDIDNVDALVEDNLVEDNEGQGIFYEISYDAVIRDNVVRGNVRLRDGQESCPLLYGAGILVAHSGNVEVHDNVVEDNCNGIGGIQQDRGSGDLGPHLLEDFFVHDNRIVMSEGRSGVTQSSASPGDAFSDQRDNRFEDNVYVVPDASEPWWAWGGEDLTWAEWNAAGHDQGGRVEEG